MATLATWFRRAEAVAEPRETGLRKNPYALRALPYEDLYFYRKSIDNSRLVRQHDPHEGSECWSTIGALCVVTIIVITTLAPSVAGLLAGYQIHELETEHARLLNEQRVLEAREAEMLNPQRLERLAVDLKLQVPDRGQVVHLNQASAGAVALNLETRPAPDKKEP